MIFLIFLIFFLNTEANLYIALAHCQKRVLIKKIKSLRDKDKQKKKKPQRGNTR